MLTVLALAMITAFIVLLSAKKLSFQRKGGFQNGTEFFTYSGAY